MADHSCAICGDLIEPVLSLSLPPECIDLMENSGQIDRDRIEENVRVHFCREDASRVERLVDRGESPLSRCDASRAEFSIRERWKDTVGELFSPSYWEEKQRWETLEDRRDFSVTTIIIAALVQGDQTVLEHVPDSAVLEAKVIYLSLAELGEISGPLVDAVTNPETNLTRESTTTH